MSEAQSPVEALFNAGVTALRAGERENARGLFTQVVRAAPNNERAWLYLAGALTDTTQQRYCLERVLALNPHNPAARKGLEALSARREDGASPVPTSSSSPVAPTIAAPTVAIPSPAPVAPTVAAPTVAPAPPSPVAPAMAAPTVAPAPPPSPPSPPAMAAAHYGLAAVGKDGASPVPTSSLPPVASVSSVATPTPSAVPPVFTMPVLPMLSARYDPDAVQPEEINTVIPSALPAPSVVEPPLLTPGRERLLAQAPAAAKSDRMVWSMVLLLGVLLMLSSAGYIVLLLG